MAGNTYTHLSSHVMNSNTKISKFLDKQKGVPGANVTHLVE